MKEEILAALVQFSPNPMRQKEKNVQFIKEKIEQLAAEGHELIVFPELSITNFFEHLSNGREAYWKDGALSFDDPLITDIVNTVKSKDVYVIVGFAERSEIIGKMYNSALLLGPEGIVGITRKMHFPGLEKLYFSPGTDIPVFDTPLGKIGISICYDGWFPEYLRTLALKGAEIIVMPSSIWKGGSKGGIGLEETKEIFWDYLPVVKAVENQVFIMACNGSGSHVMGRETGIWERMGLSKIVAPNGFILARTSGNQEVVLKAVLKRRDLEESRSVYTFLADRMPVYYIG